MERQARQKDQREFLARQKEKLAEDFARQRAEKAQVEKAQQDLEEWKKEK